VVGGLGFATLIQNIFP